MLPDPGHVQIPTMDLVPPLHQLRIDDALVAAMERALDVQVRAPSVHVPQRLVFAIHTHVRAVERTGNGRKVEVVRLLVSRAAAASLCRRHGQLLGPPQLVNLDQQPCHLCLEHLKRRFVAKLS